ncbi:hypothetical protein QZH41_003204 [Actinostola sp. cb2023]|nr:hypothetical protein QZH41_003204 [Actinostola sp. cb2023]
MKRRKTKETWEEFEKRVGLKRSGKDQDVSARVLGKVPNDILVQRMSSTPSGRLKKYEPLDTRDFVPFAEYDELTLENIKEACELYYNAPTGSCDVLASDRGPSCTKMEQLEGKKVYHIRFLEPIEESHLYAKKPQRLKSEPVSPSKNDPGYFAVSRPMTVYPKSVSIADLMRAGKLVKPPEATILKLGYFDVESGKWVTIPQLEVEIEQKHFASGAFRFAFQAKCIKVLTGLGVDWVVKKYSEDTAKAIMDTLKMSLESHARKQVPMHAVARNITARFAAKVPVEFGKVFKYDKVFYSTWNELPVTAEEFVPGEFSKYVNNDGNCVVPPCEEYDEIFEKAQSLVHFSYLYSKKKLMILDIQGSEYRCTT